MRQRLIVALFALFILFFSFSKGMSQQNIRILTASKKGEYFQAAKELSRILDGAKYRITIQESPGSFYNISKLGAGRADLALTQFDAIMLHILMGKKVKKFLKAANNCEVIAPLNYEYIHIIVNKRSNIKSIHDLKGKKVSVGPERSGSWVSAFLIMATENRVKFKKNRNIYKFSYEKAFQKLAKQEIDAMFITIMKGASLLKNIPASIAKEIELLSFKKNFQFSSKTVKKYYVMKKIPANTYAWQSTAVYTPATPSFLVAYKYLDTDMVMNLTKAIFQKADELNKKSKLWKFLDTNLAKKQIKHHVPYHTGAKKYILE